MAAQALFPLTSQFEMAGNPKENEVAGAAKSRIDYVWPILAKRVRNVPEYQSAFLSAFSDIKQPSKINIAHIANALSAFMAFEWQSLDSPFDDWLLGNELALNNQQMAGLEVFFGKGRCSTCHSGKLFSDNKFYALAVPQFGPGRTRRFDPYVRDVGRMGETDRLEDAYRFRTPSLRNVALTAPYGHNGAFETLEGIIRHHLNPVHSFQNWQPEQANLSTIPWLQEIDFIVYDDARERGRLLSRVDIEPVELRDGEVIALVTFLNSLTGSKSRSGRLGKPKTVPSGLQVD